MKTIVLVEAEEKEALSKFVDAIEKTAELLDGEVKVSVFEQER